MTEEKKVTVGEVAVGLQQKAPESRDPIEIQQELQKDYYKNLVECAEKNISVYPGDFFIVVETKRETLLENVFRNYFFARKTCPTPNYDQSVFMYDHAKGDVVYLWTIPSRDVSKHLLSNALLVVQDEKELLEMVKDFFNGNLMKMCKKLNGEELDSPLLKNIGKSYVQS